MLKSKKHVFWEALLVAIVIFVIGFLIGTAYESSNMLKVNNFYIQSEIDLADELAIIQLMNSEEYNCETLKEVNIKLANRIYEDAKVIAKYEEAGVVTESLSTMHKKFDVLRTFIWLNNFKINEQCGDYINYTLVVYVYEQDTKDLIQKADQNVWSRILTELKDRNGDDVLLIPIAADSDIASLDLILSKYDIQRYPVVIVNNQHVVTKLTSPGDIEKLF